MNEEWQQVVVLTVLGLALAGLAVAAYRSFRSFARGRCGSRCSGCASVNEAAAPAEAKPVNRVVFLPASSLRNNARERGGKG
jgi:hypothetical protein